MPSIDEVLFNAQKLTPAERLRLIARIYDSVPREQWPALSDEQAEAVYRHSAHYGAPMMEAVPWPIVERMIADCVRDGRPKIYSAPRRFDLATIFVVTSIYAVLFAGMSALQFPPVASLAVAGFVTFVGIGQALLFRGRRPRTASMVVGAFLFTSATLVLWIATGPGLRFYGVSRILWSGAACVIGGAIWGYLAGVLVGGVFLLADVVRRRFRRQPSSLEEATHDD